MEVTNMARPKQVIIGDLMGELDRFGGHITQIRDAIQSKGVTSEGKLFKFAVEINQIPVGSTYDKFSSSIESAKLKGYSDEDIMKLLNELPKKPEPQHEEPIGDDYVNDTILNITYEDVKKVEKAKRVTFSKATSIDTLAFNNFKFEKVNLPNLSNITDDYCFSRSSIKELSIPSLVWNGTDHPDITTLNPIEVLVVSENSNINGGVFNNFSDLIIYNPDKTKKWDKATSAWKPV